MLAPFLIMLREGVEAALIVSIIASYLKQTGRAQWLPAVWVGVMLAVAMSLFLGAAVLLAGQEFPQKTQELFEALVGLLAVGVLTYMLVWMHKAARSIKAELHESIESVMARSMLASGNDSGTGTDSGNGNGNTSAHARSAAWGLIGMAFFAVAREGLESVFFLLAIFQQSRGWGAPVGALAGVLVSVALGMGIYWGGVRMNLVRFFRWTSAFILLIAAGLLSGVLRNLHEAGVWNALQTRVFDWSDWLPNSSLAGTLLSGLFGYHEAPTVGEVLIWLAYLLGVMAWLLWTRPKTSLQPSAA